MILRLSTFSGNTRRQDLHLAIDTGEAHLDFRLHSIRTLFHSDGVRFIIALDHRLYGLALSSQIPPFVFHLPLGNV